MALRPTLMFRFINCELYTMLSNRRPDQRAVLIAKKCRRAQRELPRYIARIDAANEAENMSLHLYYKGRVYTTKKNTHTHFSRRSPLDSTQHCRL